jgi:hypothetical protein
VNLNHTGWVAVGQIIFVQGGGYYQVTVVSGNTVTIVNLGLTGNAAPGTPIAAGAKVSPGGIGGNAGNAYTLTSANFNQPAVGAQTASIPVLDSTWAGVGQRVYVVGGGYYTVFALADGTHMTLTNDGDPGNAAPAAVVNSPAHVSPAGLRGAAGSGGISTLNGISPTTTKGDLIADNGANSPLASDVRLAVGTNGKALVADSTQPTGLKYATITPNAAATTGDIAIFSGTAGTPLSVVDSKLLITSDGAIQSTPTGGNARGSKAVDLQVQRAANADVASGANSMIGGGKDNVASGDNSVVAGGNANSASALHSAILGGFLNIAASPLSVVVGGSTNDAQNDGDFIGGGSLNLAGGGSTVITGGSSNLTSASHAVVAGGADNSATGENSAIPGGQGAKAYLWGQVAHASANFALAGDAQASELIWRNSTTDATPTELYLKPATLRAILPTNTTWGFRGQVVARTDAGNCGMFGIRGAIKNNGGVATLVGAPVVDAVIADGGFPGGAVVAVTADGVHLSLLITVTGAVATNIRWVAHCRLIEVSF